MKKTLIISVVLALVLALTASAAGFAKTNTYAEGQFTDVQADAWYAATVQNTFELGLMNGKGGGIFDPEGDVTVAEAITMASRAAAINAGEEIPAADGEWYAMYVAYAKSKGFVKEGQFDNFDRPAKRSEVAELFAGAMPAGFFAEKNAVTAIPDVPASASYFNSVLTLYKAGVAMGSDAYGNFMPMSNITRAEAATIIARVALPEMRLEKKLDVYADDDAYLLCIMSGYGATHEGIGSGWILDNRGGTPRMTLSEAYGALTDISKEAGTALIREFNKISKGKIKLEATASSDGADGAYLEFQNEAGKGIFRLEIVDGKWQILGADGSYTPVYDIKENESMFRYIIYVDLDNSKSEVIINNVNVGTFPLTTTGADSNILNFRWATTEKGTPGFAPAGTTMYANYAACETFGIAKDGEVPYGWYGDVEGRGNTLNLKAGGQGSYGFDAVSGNVIAEYQMILRENEDTSYTLLSGSNEVFTFATNAEGFFANGEKVYEGYYNNQWYMFRFELDTDAQKVIVKVDGRKIGEVAFKEAATSVTGLKIANNSGRAVQFDDFKVFRKIAHADYVPKPVKPAGEEDYIIGLNHCPIWRNGYAANFSWSVISPYTDYELALGYYDEGFPEATDWEIKYMVEHGIDFMSICEFLPVNGKMEKAIVNEYYIFEGLYNAEYIDDIKFCLLLEIANGGAPYSFEQWTDSFVPYLIEKYFKHPSYMRIDNKAVVDHFGGSIGKYVGREVGIQCMEYLEEELKKIGYDGVYWTFCGTPNEGYEAMGFDAAHAYSWGVPGNGADANKNGILGYKNASDIVWAIPTVRVGYTNTPWGKTRTPFISKEDYIEVCRWIRDDYLKKYAKTDVQKKLVWISTWNEYGEGTFVMPTTDEKGFQYLDTIRNTFTKGDPADLAKIDVYPTASQLERITHQYPQYRHLLRKNQTYSEVIKEGSVEPLYTIDFTSKDIELSEGWIWCVDGLKQDPNNGITGSCRIAHEAIIYMAPERWSQWCPDGVPTSKVNSIIINAKLPKGEAMKIFFITSNSQSWNEEKAYTFPASEENVMTQYVLDPNKLRGFTGDLVGFRIDPVGSQGAKFAVKSIEILVNTGASVSKIFNVNGVNFTFPSMPEVMDNGDVCVPFDPAIGMDFNLNAFHVWDKAKQELTLNFIGHQFIFTVGSDKYVLDGQEKSLGYTLIEKDQLPLVPINVICDVMDYSYEVNSDGEIQIVTPAKAYFESLYTEPVPGCFEFNTPGDAEGWVSSFMSLTVAGGYMRCQSVNMVDNDPVLWLTKLQNIDTKYYNHVDIRVRYQYSADYISKCQIFFKNNKSMSESNSINFVHDSKDTNGEWVEYSVDLSTKESWTGTVTELRFDPFDAFGYCDIDYIRFTHVE